MYGVTMMLNAESDIPVQKRIHDEIVRLLLYSFLSKV